MRRIAILVAILLAATQAAAEVRTLARAGVWQAFGGASNDGTALCGMSSSAGGRWFGVKHYKGDAGFTIQLSTREWTLSEGVEVRVQIQFGRESAWEAVATSFRMGDGDPALQFDVPNDKLELWLREFRAASVMLVGFPDEAAVANWRVDLRGTNAVSARMVECIGRL